MGQKVGVHVGTTNGYEYRSGECNPRPSVEFRKGIELPVGTKLYVHTGPDHAAEPVACLTCNGKGYRVAPLDIVLTCPHCNGSGKCPAPDGSADRSALPDNLISHRGAWLDAFDRLIELEPTSSDPSSCHFGQREYWEHERNAMLAMYADLDQTQGDKV